jgi:hypothetical protein
VTARLATRVAVSALIRRANALGDFATVLKKGEESAGQIILVARRRNGDCQVLTRMMNSSGTYSWSVAAEAGQEELGKINKYLERQSRYDPDLWIVELDTDNPERLVDDELI